VIDPLKIWGCSDKVEVEWGKPIVKIIVRHRKRGNTYYIDKVEFTQPYTLRLKTGDRVIEIYREVKEKVEWEVLEIGDIVDVVREINRRINDIREDIAMYWCKAMRLIDILRNEDGIDAEIVFPR